VTKRGGERNWISRTLGERYDPDFVGVDSYLSPLSLPFPTHIPLTHMSKIKGNRNPPISNFGL